MSSSPDSEVCRKERAQTPPSLFQNGNLVFQAHHVGWILAGCFTIVATVASFWLVNKHLQWYTNKKEQRYIVRLLFMVPLYATISLASYLWWNHATPLILIRDGYESTVLTAFFYLLLMYLSPDPDEQRRIFMKDGLSRQSDAERMKKGEPVKRWVFPLGFIKWKPVDGLYFLQLMKWGVLQYCVLRPLTTFIAVILDYMGLYCESSWGLGWGHIYITIIVSLSVTVAMYCLIQLYVAVSRDLAKHKPLLKLFAIKAVVFLTFWQATFLSVLSMFGVVKDTKYMTAEDINIGIGALLETFEMMLFAFLHIRAFTYKPYRPSHDGDSDIPPPERTPRLKSLGHAMDFRETFRELWAGCVYIWHKFRGKEPTLDMGAVRAAHYESAFGKKRPSKIQRDFDDGSDEEKVNLKQPTLPMVQVEIDKDVEVDIGGERQWLGIGDNYGYGLKFLRRERSEGLEEQIAKELEKRGYTLRNDEADQQQAKHPKQKSWWRSIYGRISQTGHDELHQAEGGNLPHDIDGRSRSRSRTERRSRSKRLSGDGDAGRRLLAHADASTEDVHLEDRPPPSLIPRSNRHELRQSVDKWRQSIDPQYGTVDVLMPLPVPVPDHRRGYGCGRHGERSINNPGLFTSSYPMGFDSRQSTHLSPGPGSESRLEKMFKSAVNDPPVEPSHAPTDTAQSEISSAEGYRLAKPTPPVRFIHNQPAVLPVNKRDMTAQRRSTLYHLTDGDTHVPMTADVVDIGSYDIAEQEDRILSAAPIRTHQRESANHRSHLGAFPAPPAGPTIFRQQLLQSHAGPSTSPPQSPSTLRRSSAQYHSRESFSRKRHSLPTNIDISYPSSPTSPTASGRRRQPYHTTSPGQGHRVGELGPALGVTRNFPPQLLPLSTSPPRNYKLPHATHSPTSPIDDGLSRYPPHLSPTYTIQSRNS